MRLRRFTSEGLQRFREFLAGCREWPMLPVPRVLLEDDTVTTIVSPTIEVHDRPFANRAESAHYLTELLRPLRAHEVARDVGLWSWLTLFYFDSICPDSGGTRSVKTIEHYIYEPDHPYRSYRHLLRCGWQALRDAPEHHRLLLHGPLSRIDHVAAEVLKRLYLMRIPCIFEVVDRLYWDERRGCPKRGITSSGRPKPGDLRSRLPKRLRQLEKTFDLFSLTADQLIDLLGDEFRQQEPAAMRATRRAADRTSPDSDAAAPSPRRAR